MHITVNIKACHGCRTCELVCSFHHEGIFSSELGSIRVYRENKNGNVKWFIDSTCDFCKGEDEPLCVKYCLFNALRTSKN